MKPAPSLARGGRTDGRTQTILSEMVLFRRRFISLLFVLDICFMKLSLDDFSPVPDPVDETAGVNPQFVVPELRKSPEERNVTSVLVMALQTCGDKGNGPKAKF